MAVSAMLVVAALAPLAAADTALTLGQPYSTRIGKDVAAYFTVPLTAGSNNPLRITVGASAGDPDMFVGCTARPSWRNYGWKQTELGNDTLALSPADLSGKGCTTQLYISVVGAGPIAGDSEAVSFTILAYYESSAFAQTLTEGQASFLATGSLDIAYAKFVVPAGNARSVTFSMSVFIGMGAELYVSQVQSGAPPQFPVYQCLAWSGSTGLCKEAEVRKDTYSRSTTDAGQSPGSVRFPTSSQGQTFVVALISSDGGTTMANVDVALGSDALPLILGEPQYSSLAQGAYQQYALTLQAPPDQSTPEFIINAHPLWGLAAVFASETVTPTNGTHTWGSSPSADDAQVAIRFNQLSATCQAALQSNGTCPLNVAVQSVGANDCYVETYATVSGSSAEPLILEQGSSLLVDLPARTYGYVYSKLDVPRGQPAWTLSFETLSGFGDAWIVIGDGRRFYPHTSADAKPSFAGGQAVARFEPPPQVAEGLAGHRCAIAARERHPGPIHWEGTPAELEEARKWAEAVARIPAGDTTTPCPEGDVGAVVPGVYCSNCEVRVSLYGGVLGMSTTVTLQVDGVNDLTPLAEGEPAVGEVGAGAFVYYSFEVDLSTPVPISFTVDRQSGDPDVYVTVRDPAAPNRLPSTTNFTWKSVASGSDRLLIDPRHPAYVSKGTYLVGVYGGSYFYADSRFSITARAESASLVNPLPEDEDVSVTISSRSYSFFIFSPCAAEAEDDNVVPSSGCGTDATPAVKFNWAATRGNVNVYITNSYAPGASPTYLPRAGNGLVQLWSYTSGQRQAVINSSTTGYDAKRRYYTIGIQSTSMFDVTATLRGIVQAPDIVNIVRLDIGATSGPYTPTAQTNMFFAFDYGDQHLGRDVFIGVATETGRVDTVVAPPNRVTGQQASWAPRCGPDPHGSISPLCLGYIWKSTWQSGSNVGISHFAPCFPVDGPRPATNCSVGDFRTGTWLVTVYAEVDSAFTITASVGDSHIELAENEPQEATTVYTHVCSDRDANSNVCPPSTGKSSPAFAAWFQTTLPIAGPDSGAEEDVQIDIERDCALLGCGPELQAYAVSCFQPGTAPAGRATCGALSAFPTAEYHQLHTIIKARAGSLPIPGNTPCGPALTWQDDVFSNDDDWWARGGPVAQPRSPLGGPRECTWYVGVFSGRSANSAGMRETFQTTLSVSNDDSITTIGQQETTPGTTFTGPPEALQTDFPKKFYDAFFNETQQTAVRATAYACSGTPTIYACEPGSGCTDQRHPGPGASGASQTGAYSPSDFFASVTVQQMAAGELNLGVWVDPASSASPSFQLQLATGSGPVLVAPMDLQAARSSSSAVEVSWGNAFIYRSGAALTTVTRWTPTLYLFDADKLPTGSVLGTQCGVAAAWAAATNQADEGRDRPQDEQEDGARALRGDGQGYLALPFRKRLSAQDNFYRVTGVPPSANYVAALVIECGYECMPSGAPPQTAAAKPAVNPGPSPSPGPAPSGGPYPSPSPASGGGGGGGSGPDGGTIAGIVVGVLGGLGVAGGLFFYCRRRNVVGDDMDGYYTSAD